MIRFWTFDIHILISECMSVDQWYFRDVNFVTEFIYVFIFLNTLIVCSQKQLMHFLMCTWNIFGWNVRGFDKSSHRSGFKKWIRNGDYLFGSLLETHVQQGKQQKFMNSLLPGWFFDNNYSFSDLGKIWILWHLSVQSWCLLQVPAACLLRGHAPVFSFYHYCVLRLCIYRWISSEVLVERAYFVIFW